MKSFLKDTVAKIIEVHSGILNNFKSSDLVTKIFARNERRKERSEEWKQKMQFWFSKPGWEKDENSLNQQLLMVPWGRL